MSNTLDDAQTLANDTFSALKDAEESPTTELLEALHEKLAEVFVFVKENYEPDLDWDETVGNETDTKGAHTDGGGKPYPNQPQH